MASFFTAAVTQTGGAGVHFDAVVEQTRAASITGIGDFDAAVSFTTTFTGVYDNATSRIRWTSARIVFDGSDLHPTAYFGRITEDESMTPGQARTMRFSPIGPLWTIPTEDYTPPAGSGAFDNPPGAASPVNSPPEAGTTTPFSPRSWGNKDVSLYLSFGASPRTMAETKVYQGVTLQKSNRGDILIAGDITCSDDSIKYANVPLCYQLAPFGGMRRDQIVRDLAANVGVPANKVFVPIGGIVTKPILLSNGSLLPFVNEFGAPENWFAFFDEDGDFVVQRIELKDEPDWTIDARRGDFDLDTFEEQLPSMPPTRYYASGTVPVSGTGAETTSTSSEVRAIYNPLCVKVRPSGASSYLQGDGSYRSLAAATEMVVSRVTTEITTTNGRETKRVIKTYQFYNPLRYDPNFDTAPPGASYDGAYGDQTFHRDEVESLMLFRTVTTENAYDINGTLQQQTTTTEGWYAPKRAGNYSADRKALTNVSGVCFVFPGGTTRTLAEEQFMVTNRIQTTNTFDATGVLTQTDTKELAWFAPPSRCDVPLTDVTLTDPPPEGGGGQASSFAPSLVGPLSTAPSTPFDGSAIGIPGGHATEHTLYGVFIYEPTPGVSKETPPYYTSTYVGDDGQLNWSLQILTANNASGYAEPGEGVQLIDPFFYAFLRVKDASGVYYDSPRIYFDPR